MLIEENKPLAPLTTFSVGGPARWFVRATSEADVAEAAAWAQQRRIPVFVLGGGSNLLISDAGFNGLVLRVELRGLTSADTPEKQTAGKTAEPPSHRIYQVAAGEEWDRFVERAVGENCAGVECLAGIPGTAGGTPVQNVGAYGQEVSAAIERVRAFDLRQRDFVEFSAAECGFSYRRSRFSSTDPGRFVVTRVDYRLTPGGAPTVRYAELQRAIAAGAAEPTLSKVAAQVRQLRQKKGMLMIAGDPDCRSAGSFFKNPVVGVETLRRIMAVSGQKPPCFPAGPETEYRDKVKVPAAWLIEQAGFRKGQALGEAGISSRHTLALVNRGNATAAQILALAEKITSAVMAHFGIRLEMEPVKIGF
ncbi:MAG: UDP-N-acetylmuramate dehydrogenase [Terracidiphilus sp.]